MKLTYYLMMKTILYSSFLTWIQSLELTDKNVWETLNKSSLTLNLHFLSTRVTFDGSVWQKCKERNRFAPHHAHGLVHVTVTENDERGLPAQLQRNLLQVAEGTAEDQRRRGSAALKCSKQTNRLLPLHDLLADRRGASETQLANVRMVGQTLPHHAT